MSAALTPEEMEAVREQSRPVDKTTSLDLAAGDRSVRRGFGSLSRILSTFAAGAAQQLQLVMRRNVKAHEQPLEVVGPQAAGVALEGLPLVMQLRIQGSLAGYIGVDQRLAIALVEKAFGGLAAVPKKEDAAKTQEIAAKKLTKLQVQMVTPFANQLVDRLGKAFEAVVEAKRLGDNDELELPRGLSSFALWQVELACPGLEGALTLLLLPDLVDTATRPRMVAPARETARIALHLMDAEVEVSAVLGAAHLTVAELLALRPGDLIRLEGSTADPCVVLVQDEPKFVAQPLQRAGGLAVTVEGLLK